MHTQRFTCVLVASLFFGPLAIAQQVQSLVATVEAPELIGAQTATSNAPVDLGQDSPTTPAVRSQRSTASTGVTVAGMSLPAPLANTGGALAAAQRAKLRNVAPNPVSGPVERAVFAREPVRVNLTVGLERLITLPADALLHVPNDMDAVARLETIAGTIYATALAPFEPIRIIAELVDSGQQIPIDLVSQATTTKGAVPRSAGELQVSVFEPASVANPMAQTTPAAAPAVDMVELTRHAARQLYAPRRLSTSTPGVSQVAIGHDAVPGLLRGVHVETATLGQWRSANLFVTAVRITNLSKFALEIPLESIRGRWIAATAQHGRIGPAGSDTDTTALYLVCERSFESCL